MLHRGDAAVAATSVAASGRRCLLRTNAAFSGIGATFLLLLSAAYTQISSLPRWDAFRLCLTIAVPVSLVASLILLGLSRAAYRGLVPDPSNAEPVQRGAGVSPASSADRRARAHALAQ